MCLLVASWGLMIDDIGLGDHLSTNRTARQLWASSSISEPGIAKDPRRGDSYPAHQEKDENQVG